MSEIYCIDCEMAIKLPSSFDRIIGGSSKEAQPVKYKQGWRCPDCDRKHRK